MADDIKRELVILLLFTAIATGLIAVALPGLEFKPGIPLPDLGAHSEPAALTPASSISFPANMLVQAILILFIAVAVVWSGYSLLRGAGWKATLRDVLSLVVWFMGATIALVILMALVHVRISVEPLQPELTRPALDLPGPPLGSPPPELIWLAWIGLGLVAVLLGVSIIRWKQNHQSVDPLRLEAEQALRALRAGQDYRNVVVRCYEQMSVALQEEKGIELEQAMTTRDFERLLQARGLARTPVHRMTQLFEAARYGYQPPSSQDEQDAVDCLNQIVEGNRQESESN